MKLNNAQIQLSEFIKEFSKSQEYSNNALVKISTYESVNNDILEFKTVLTKLSGNQDSYDFVFVDLPFGIQKEPSRLDESKKVNKNWNIIFDSLQLVNSKGFLFAVAEPSLYASKRGKEFLAQMCSQGFSCNLLLKVPDKIYYPHTSFNPILLGFQRTEIKDLFVASIDGDNYQSIISNFNNRQSESLLNGKFLQRNEFSSFNKAIIEEQIEGLQTQYKEYRKFNLADISQSVNLTKEQFEEIPNSIYIPKLGTSKVVADINQIKIKHQNIFQVILKTDIVLSEYLELFYRSEIGQLILSSLNTGSFIPSINKSSILESFVSIPPIAEQKVLIHTDRKLTEIQETIDDLKHELSLNPKNAEVILEKYDAISAPLKKLSIEDEILSLIRKGENKKIEFKQTFSKDVNDKGIHKSVIQKASLKNIVGFLNADGGTLLIGVTDDGEITGIEEDNFTSKDKYLLNFKSLLKAKIGEEYYPLIEFDLFSVLGKTVLKIDCEPSKKPCYFEGNEFYVRTNPATDKLDGRKLIEYVKRRFNE